MEPNDTERWLVGKDGFLVGPCFLVGFVLVCLTVGVFFLIFFVSLLILWG